MLGHVRFASKELLSGGGGRCLFSRQNDLLAKYKKLNGLNGSIMSTRNVKTSTVDWKPIISNKTPTNEDAEDEYKHGGKKHKNYHIGKKIFLGLMIAMPITAAYLGTWQTRRLKWKTRLIATCETRLTYPIVPIPKNFSEEDLESWEYRRVQLVGHFENDNEIYVGPRVHKGIKGYNVFTPFVRDDTGERLLIERGWVSEEKIVPSSRNLKHLSTPENEHLSISCLVRVPHERGQFQWDKKSDDVSRVWQVPDILEMSKRLGCKPLHLQVLYDLNNHSERLSDSNTSSMEFSEWQLIQAGVPIGQQPKVMFRNNHLQYIVTWYGLSFLSSILLVVAIRRGMKGKVITHAQLRKQRLDRAKEFE
ncbi:hypothetical protein TBLA_0C05430 [Henningerozyma blattae CBS 6284]|uniref:SURF1-like protein n=1 Tax=Henningerozyma blattae (strain ATCC 34711 / CBS 6284 / DSM 70876 / NBRC 10599 / NRRL Y-10934 / UCD 77-7) TaxID=1071380 RepID=I2H1T9_HENB6|nr:hypothetical protein TBLA_0C05430 [Tetrapisispora blattae CBS 6284]CCH60341.1 hypothetical protein TBLA_0C05430 [Tetrapisispora blattae CBS 6284]